MHHAMRGQRRFPRERLVDPFRPAVRVHRQVFRPARIAQDRPVQRLSRCHLVMRSGVRRERLGVGRLQAEAARDLYGSEHELQEVQGATGLETVGVGADAAHRVHRYRSAHHRLVPLAAKVGPGPVKRDRPLEGSMCQFQSNTADGGRRDAASHRYGLGRVLVVEVLFGELLKDRHGALVGAVQRRPDARYVEGVKCARRPIAHQWLAGVVALEQPVGIYQHRGIGVPGQVVQVDPAGFQQHVHEAEDKQTIRSGLDRQPFVRDRIVAGADRIHGDDPGSARLQSAKAHLDRVGIVVLGHAEEKQQLGAFPVRRAELPE